MSDAALSLTGQEGAWTHFFVLTCDTYRMNGRLNRAIVFSQLFYVQLSHFSILPSR